MEVHHKKKFHNTCVCTHAKNVVKDLDHYEIMSFLGPILVPGIAMLPLEYTIYFYLIDIGDCNQFGCLFFFLFCIGSWKVLRYFLPCNAYLSTNFTLGSILSFQLSFSLYHIFFNYFTMDCILLSRYLCHATGDQLRNNSGKNEGMEPKQKEYLVVDGTGDRSKV